MATDDSWMQEALLSAMKIDEDFDKEFKVRLDTGSAQQNAAYAYGQPTFAELADLMRRVNAARSRAAREQAFRARQNEKPGRCTAANCSVESSYRLTYAGRSEKVCRGHALVLLQIASENGVKLVLYQLGQITHQMPADEGGVMTCCGRTPFEVHRFDMMTSDLSLVTCKPLRN